MRAIVFLGLTVLLHGGTPVDLQSIARALEKGDFKEGLQMIEPALKITPGDPRLWFFRGKALDELGHTGESERSYRRALSLRPKFIPALQGLAELQYKTSDPGARATIEMLLTATPEDKTVHAMLGVIEFEAKQYQVAVSHFAKAGNIVTGDSMASWQFAQSLLVLGRPGRAAEIFGGMLESDRNNPKLRFNLALSLFEARNYPEAEKALQPLSGTPKPAAEVLSLLGSIQLARREAESAMITLQRAVSLYPDREQPYVDVAALCMERSAILAGLNILDTGLRNLPGSQRLHALRGAFYAQTGEWEKAQADFDQADREGTAVRGVALLESGKLDESVAYLRAHLQKNPSDSKSWYLLAEALWRKGADKGSPDAFEARQAVNQALKLEPGFLEARLTSGKLHAREGKLDEAAENFQKVVSADPGNRLATFQLSQALRRLGRSTEANQLSAKLSRMLAEELNRDSKRTAARMVHAAPSRIPLSKEIRSDSRGGERP